MKAEEIYPCAITFDWPTGETGHYMTGNQQIHYLTLEEIRSMKAFLASKGEQYYLRVFKEFDDVRKDDLEDYEP